MCSNGFTPSKDGMASQRRLWPDTAHRQPPSVEMCPRCSHLGIESKSEPVDSFWDTLPPDNGPPVIGPTPDQYREGEGSCPHHTLFLWQCPLCNYQYFTFFFHLATRDRRGAWLTGRLDHFSTRSLSQVGSQFGYESRSQEENERHHHQQQQQQQQQQQNNASGPDLTSDGRPSATDRRPPWDPCRERQTGEIDDGQNHHPFQERANQGFGPRPADAANSSVSEFNGAAGIHPTDKTYRRRRRNSTDTRRMRSDGVCDWCRFSAKKCRKWHPGNRRTYTEWNKNLGDTQRRRATELASKAAEAVCDHCRWVDSPSTDCRHDSRWCRTPLRTWIRMTSPERAQAAEDASVHHSILQ